MRSAMTFLGVISCDQSLWHCMPYARREGKLCKFALHPGNDHPLCQARHWINPTHSLTLCENFVMFLPTLMIFGTKMAKRIKLC